MSKRGRIGTRAMAAVLAAGALAGCGAGGGLGAGGGNAVAADALRPLTDDEKKIITQAVVRGQGSPQIQWTGFPANPPAEGRYCARSGGRIFAALVSTSGGQITAAQLLAIGGGPGTYVDQECRRYYQNPFT